MLTCVADDQYVRFTYENLRGYEDALGRAMSLRISPAEARKKFFEDSDFAKLYGFPNAEFLKNDRSSTNRD